MDGATPRWADIRAMARGGRGDRLRRRLGLRPRGLRRPGHRRRLERRLGVVDAADGARRGHVARPAGHVRQRRAVPQPGAAGEDGRDARRGVRRAGHPGPRRGLERARVRRLRVPVGAPVRPVRGRAADRRPRCSARAAPTTTGLESARGALVRPRGPRPERPAGHGRRVRPADAPARGRARRRVERRDADRPRSWCRCSRSWTPRSQAVGREPGLDPPLGGGAWSEPGGALGVDAGRRRPPTRSATGSTR